MEKNQILLFLKKKKQKDFCLADSSFGTNTIIYQCVIQHYDRTGFGILADSSLLSIDFMVANGVGDQILVKAEAASWRWPKASLYKYLVTDNNR